MYANYFWAKCSSKKVGWLSELNLWDTSCSVTADHRRRGGVRFLVNVWQIHQAEQHKWVKMDWTFWEVTPQFRQSTSLLQLRRLCVVVRTSSVGRWGRSEWDTYWPGGISADHHQTHSKVIDEQWFKSFFLSLSFFFELISSALWCNRSVE